jgi:hypothetical protein
LLQRLGPFNVNRAGRSAKPPARAKMSDPEPESDQNVSRETFLSGRGPKPYKPPYVRRALDECDHLENWYSGWLSASEGPYLTVADLLLTSYAAQRAEIQANSRSDPMFCYAAIAVGTILDGCTMSGDTEQRDALQQAINSGLHKFINVASRSTHPLDELLGSSPARLPLRRCAIRAGHRRHGRELHGAIPERLEHS